MSHLFDPIFCPIAAMLTEIAVKYGCLLVADAHQNMLEGIRTLLAELFEVVVMVADEDSLLGIFVTINPDLIIVDLSLPPTGAERILRRLRLSDSPSPVKVIILSVHDEAEVVHEAIDAGAMGLVLKRSAATDMIPAVEAVLKGDTYISPGVQKTLRSRIA
jgi:DNA-binding NarL/FixJ family response regulator